MPQFPSRRSVSARRPRIARAALAVGVLALASPAGADAAWQQLAATDVGGPDRVDEVHAVAPTGVIDVAFTDRASLIGVAEHRAGAWASPVVPAPSFYGLPSMASGRSGAAAMWAVAPDGTPRLSTRTAGGTWSAWGPIGPAGGAPQVETKVTIDHDDRVVAFWRERIPGQDEVGFLTSSRPVAGGAWSAPVRIGTVQTGGYETDPSQQIRQDTGQIQSLQVGPDGTVVVAWTTAFKATPSRGGGASVFGTESRFALRGPDGAWEPARRFSSSVEGADDGYPAEANFGWNGLQLDDSGALWAFAARGRATSAGDEEATEVLRLAPGASTFVRTALLPLSDEQYPVDRQWLATVMDDGRMIVHRRIATDTGSLFGTIRLVARTSLDGRSWTPERTISPEGVTVDWMTTAVNRAQGVVTFALQTGAPNTDEYNRDGPTTVSARDWYPWDDSFSQVFEVPGATKLHNVGIDDRSDSLFRVGTTSGRTTFVVDDASGPDIDGVTSPATLKPKAQGTFSVRATDQFSKLGTYRWDFGDGKTGKGATVKHAFRTAGTKTVSVTVTDRWGNASATSVVVTVKAGGADDAGATVRSDVPVKAAARTGGRIRVSRVRLQHGRLALHASGAGKLLVTLQRRTGTAKHPSYVPGPVVRVQPRGAGDVVARVKGLRHGSTYRVRVRADAGSPRDVRRLGVHVRAGR